MMQALIEILHREQCSLVVRHDGEVSTYGKPGVRDLVKNFKYITDYATF